MISPSRVQPDTDAQDVDLEQLVDLEQTYVPCLIAYNSLRGEKMLMAR